MTSDLIQYMRDNLSMIPWNLSTSGVNAQYTATLTGFCIYLKKDSCTVCRAEGGGRVEINATAVQTLFAEVETFVKDQGELRSQKLLNDFSQALKTMVDRKTAEDQTSA